MIRNENAITSGVPIFPVSNEQHGMYSGPPVKWVKASDGNSVVIATNAQAPILCYTKKIENPDLWDASFEQGMIAGLASQLAFPITGDLKIKGTLAQDANQVLMEARAADGNEGLVIYDHVPDWIQARGYGGVYAVPGSTQSEPWGPLFS